MTCSTVPALFRSGLVLGMLAAPSGGAGAQPQDAAPATRDANAAVLQQLPFADRDDFADARRGFVAALPDGLIAGAGPRPAWNMKAYDFLDKAEAPATVNPSLWRQAQLNALNGLFKIADRVYQLRGLDIANMTIVEGDRGLIAIDTRLTAETARAALELYYQHRPRKPLVAVIYSHSHADHFGGVKCVVSEGDVQAKRVRIYAPDGFMAHAVAQNVIAGNAWARYIDGALALFGDKSDVLIAQHHWPVWGGAKIKAYLTKQRDLYKFINDQSLRLLNQGFTPGEIAEQLTLPASLAQEWALRG